MDNFLKTGDVFELLAGEKVYAEVKEKFVYANCRSNSLTESEIVIGESYKYSPEDELEKECEVFLNKLKKYDIKNIHLENLYSFLKIEKSNLKEEEFSVLPGEYLVYKTEVSGGSGSGARDYYPDGHKVFAIRLKDGSFDKKGSKVSFFQSGCFTAMIQNRKPTRKMEMTFV